MKHYYTSLFTFQEYIKENGHNRLTKFEKIQWSKGTPKSLKINEIFDKEINELDYSIQKYNHPLYENEYNYTYLFKTEKENEYRLDFVILKENAMNHQELENKKFISISFSPSNSTAENYDELTNKYEQYDLLNRIKFLIDEYRKIVNENEYVFMFGQPTDKKFNIYKYLIYKCFPNYRILKDKTTGFPETNIGYYLIKN